MQDSRPLSNKIACELLRSYGRAVRERVIWLQAVKRLKYRQHARQASRGTLGLKQNLLSRFELRDGDGIDAQQCVPPRAQLWGFDRSAGAAWGEQRNLSARASVAAIGLAFLGKNFGVN
jgi:hypothetical protein